MPLFDSSLFVPLATVDARPAVSFRLVTDVAELRALAPEWQQLLDESACPEPMRSPTWLLPWWDVYGAITGRAVRVGVWREGETLVGLLPLCARRYWHRPGIPFLRLEYLGSDVDEQDGVCSEYLGPIFKVGYEETLAKQFAHQIHRHSFGPLHEIVLASMNGDEPVTTLLETALHRADGRVERQISTEAPYLTLPKSWNAYLKSLDRKKRYNITRALRDFDAWAGTEWVLHEVRSPAELTQGQAILRSLHDQRWQEGETSSGAYAAPRFGAFHAAVMPRLLAEGKLDLLWLSVRGEPIAVHYQIAANRKVYFYQCGRSMVAPPNLRVGIVMLAHALQRAIQQGLREFDFLGGPALYKMQLTQTTRPLVQLRIAPASIRERLRQGAQCVIGWARQIRDRVRTLHRAARSSAQPDVNNG